LTEAKNEANNIYVKTMANGGQITFDSTLGTSLEANKNELTIDFNNASDDYMAGFSANISVNKGHPQLGLGALACNIGSVIYQTRLAATLEQFSAAVVDFPK